MKYMIFWVVVITELLSCTGRKGASDIFSDYLQLVHHTEIPKGTHTYVVVPENIGCVGCSTHTIDYLTTHRLNRVTVICGPSNAEYFQGGFYPVLVDSLSEIEHLNLQTQNVAILATKDGELKEIISLQANDLDSTLAAYFGKP